MFGKELYNYIWSKSQKAFKSVDASAERIILSKFVGLSSFFSATLFLSVFVPRSVWWPLTPALWELWQKGRAPLTSAGLRFPPKEELPLNNHSSYSLTFETGLGVYSAGNKELWGVTSMEKSQSIPDEEIFQDNRQHVQTRCTCFSTNIRVFPFWRALKLVTCAVHALLGYISKICFYYNTHKCHVNK